MKYLLSCYRMQRAARRLSLRGFICIAALIGRSGTLLCKINSGVQHFSAQQCTDGASDALTVHSTCVIHSSAAQFCTLGV